jgi:hypothetical protein
VLQAIKLWRRRDRQRGTIYISEAQRRRVYFDCDADND